MKEKFNQEELEYRTQERKVNASINWLEAIPEAKDYIFARAIEINKEIDEIKKRGDKHIEQINIESHGKEKEGRLILVSVLYQSQINKKAELLHQINKGVSKYVAKIYFQNTDDPKGFSPEEIEIARNTSIVSLFENDGNVLKVSGSNFITLCPFHSEKTPSCTLYCNENRYYCYGCNAKGNSIDYLINRHQLSFRESMSILIGRGL